MDGQKGGSAVFLADAVWTICRWDPQQLIVVPFLLCNFSTVWGKKRHLRGAGDVAILSQLSPLRTQPCVTVRAKNRERGAQSCDAASTYVAQHLEIRRRLTITQVCAIFTTEQGQKKRTFDHLCAYNSVCSRQIWRHKSGFCKVCV